MSGRHYLDGDGDIVEGWADAINFGCEAYARTFLKENPCIASKRHLIVKREFSEKDLMSFMKSYDMHMHLKKRDLKE